VKGRWFAALLALVAPAAITAQAPVAAPATEPTPDWRALAQQDVRAAYDIFAENHPGMHDPTNRAFPAQLARARDKALAAAARAAGRRGYVEALGAFSAELSDGHALVYATTPAGASPGENRWPGFVAAWRGDRMVVHHAGRGSPAPTGSQIVSCDGRPIAQVVRSRLTSVGFRAGEAGHWWARAPQALTSAEELGPPPRGCRFRHPNGVTKSATLNWVRAPENLSDLLRQASDGDRNPIGLNEPRPGIFLVSMPTFSPDTAGVTAYRALFDAVGARRAELLRARAVVLDLRHNNGGSSSWSRQLAEALWGKEPVTHAMGQFFRNVEIWWRTSEGNISHMAKMAEQARANGNAQAAAYSTAQGEAMRAARGQGEPLWAQQRASERQVPQGPVPPSDFRAPVYVITPGRCASACLDAVDTFTRFGNVRLIGAPTSADSTYMEVRSQPLPSGRGVIVIPTKVWLGRPRAGGEIYKPHIVMDALDWSTASFLDRIERDLTNAQRKR
jgi:hypothetical protein